jgi:hypothetical protein
MAAGSLAFNSTSFGHALAQLLIFFFSGIGAFIIHTQQQGGY